MNCISHTHVYIRNRTCATGEHSSNVPVTTTYTLGRELVPLESSSAMPSFSATGEHSSNMPVRSIYTPRPSCSKLTMLLVILIIKYGIYANIFCWKNVSSFCICKSYSHFFSKNTCALDIVLTRTFNISTTKELVKLTMLWTTGPRKKICYYYYYYTTFI